MSFGYIEELGDKLYNSQVVIGFDGEIVHNHRKCNLTAKEREVFAKGEKPISSFFLDGHRVSICICYDYFSQNFKKHYNKKTNIVLHSLTDPQDGRFTLGYSGRRNPAYYIASNRFSNNEGRYYNGHIGIYDSKGKRRMFSTDKENILSYNFSEGVSFKSNRLLLKIKMITHLLVNIRKTVNYIFWSLKN